MKENYNSSSENSVEIEAKMKKFYDSLSEKDKRRYAAIEAKKIGRGGPSYIARLFGCSRNTILRGAKEIEQLNLEQLNQAGIRQKGGGRKRLVETRPDLDAAFLEVVQNHTVENSLTQGKKWTYLSQVEIARELERLNFKVSVSVIKQLLKKYKFIQNYPAVQQSSDAHRQ
ncbi:hypothetical protein IQ260_10670 [Leptolyngbya cf. ectocarpi LEGE 11479]|uniref:Transposase n=1 Tax=Leptolyngbya cf. ectocarpi LEGE 11479 TaxID=1828722 RepID=A0A928X5B7_LEPEC|nr:hypothetical protein [Leptolyngbya ectocarpi]MBE9067118.1 hypothetical protein [Leptolyngbya cf. ectocarpi LEGE 11479]